MTYVYRITYGGICEVWVESDGRTITKVLAATAGDLAGQEIQDLPRPTYVEAKLMASYSDGTHPPPARVSSRAALCVR